MIGIEVDGDLAVFVGVELGAAGPLGRAGVIEAAVPVGAQAGVRAEEPVFEHAAPDGDGGTGQGRAVGLHQGQLHLGGLPQADGVQGVELELGGVPLAGQELLLLDGAQVLLAVIDGAELHIAGDAGGLVEGQHAVFVGLDLVRPAIPVVVPQSGLRRRGHLEQVELVLQGGGVDFNAGAHAGGGVGGGDGGAAALSGGNPHQQLGQIGVVAEVLNVLVQPALLVVDGDGVVVGGPADAVPEGVPGVGVVVDADVLQQAQLLPQGQDLLRVRQPFGVYNLIIIIVTHLDRTVDPVPVLVHQPQAVAVVDVEGEGVGAGGLVAVVHREGDLIGVLQALVDNAPLNLTRYLRWVQGVGAGCRADREGGDHLQVVVRPYPLDGEGGLLSLGQILQLPADVHGLHIIGDVEVRRPDQPGGDGLALQDDAHPVRQGLARILRVGGGDHHGVGHRVAPRGHLRQHARRDLDAGGLAGFICGHQGRLIQYCILAREVAPIELDRVRQRLLPVQERAQVAAPAQGQGGVPLGGHGVGGKAQVGRRPGGHIELPVGLAGHIVAGVRCAVVGGEGTPDPAAAGVSVRLDLAVCDITGIIGIFYDGGKRSAGVSVHGFAGPIASGIGGVLAGPRVEIGPDGGPGALI